MTRIGLVAVFAVFACGAPPDGAGEPLAPERETVAGEPAPPEAQSPETSDPEPQSREADAGAPQSPLEDEAPPQSGADAGAAPPDDPEEEDPEQGEEPREAGLWDACDVEADCPEELTCASSPTHGSGWVEGCSGPEECGWVCRPVPKGRGAECAWDDDCGEPFYCVEVRSQTEVLGGLCQSGVPGDLCAESSDCLSGSCQGPFHVGGLWGKVCR